MILLLFSAIYGIISRKAAERKTKTDFTGGCTLLFDYKIAAICTSRIHEETMRDFIHTFSQALAPYHWRVLVFTTSSDLYHQNAFTHGEETIFELLGAIEPDAVLVFQEKLHDAECLDRICQNTANRQIPTYIIEGTHAGCSDICFDFESGFEAVVRHLTDHHGIRDFHFIAGQKGNPFSETRKEIMWSVMREYGISFGEEQISYGDFWSSPTEAAVEKLIAENRLPRAIVCANDTMALTVNSVLQKHGYRIPEDVIVTGFDGLDDVYFSNPKVTSCKCDYCDLGNTAAELVRTGQTGQHIRITPKFLLLESCGCHAETAIDSSGYITMLHNTFHRYHNENSKLSEISSAIQSSRSLDEVASHLYHHLFYNMTSVLTEEFTDVTLDPMIRHSRQAFGENVYVLSDSNVPDSPDNGKLYPVRNIVPRMQYALQSEQPQILIALHQMELPLGYLVFQYEQPSYANYLKISQISVFLSSALGSYRSIRYQQHLQETYRFDQLTGLLTRSSFLQQLEIQRSIRPGESATLVLCDLDGLKFINDHYSHQEGDHAIRTVANAMRKVCADGLCCRYGGDELVSILSGIQSAEQISRDITALLDEYAAQSDKPYSISASIGISAGQDDFDTLFANADEIMYRNKTAKKAQRRD